MISVIIPVLNESPTVNEVVKFAFRSPEVSEVIVVDDGSIDGTPEIAAAAGARVITSTFLGKGASMEDGVWAASNEVIVFLDGDLSSLESDLIAKIAAPLIKGEADFVKAKFSRTSGRVTVLTAKPLLQTFFPELNRIDQPLGGIVASTKTLLRKQRFETDYGVDVGLLLDLYVAGARIVEVDIGRIEHDSQRLEVLGDMARQVARAILSRASEFGRLELSQVREVEEVERSAEIELSHLVSRLGQPERLALFDMDGTLLRGRFVEALARRVNRLEQLGSFLDNPSLTFDERTEGIASLFERVDKKVFEDVARSIPLMDGARETIIWLRKNGYRVGIVSDSFLVATEIVRRRVFADFSVAHMMMFRSGSATGRIRFSPAMLHENGCTMHACCKFNSVLHLSDQLRIPRSEILAVGDGPPDCCLFRGAGVSVAFQPKDSKVAEAADFVIHGSLSELREIIEKSPFRPQCA